MHLFHLVSATYQVYTADFTLVDQFTDVMYFLGQSREAQLCILCSLSVEEMRTKLQVLSLDYRAEKQ